jgi:opacity protein-like surface antigen
MKGIWLAILAMGAILGTSAAQASDIGLYAVEARIGWVSIDEGDAGSTYGLSLGADLGRLSPELRLEAGLDYWTKSWDVGYTDWSWSNVAFLGNIRYDFTKESKFVPYAFGGMAICIQSWNWDWPGCQAGGFADVCTVDDSEIEFGLDLGIGAEIDVGGSMIPTARIGYNANGGSDYFFVQGGLRFPLK